uniref:Uncharacterized protein n=1 Tax=Glossina brevipalpis TaxID=37001 RepID=A0A1A9WBD5_9MUSC
MHIVGETHVLFLLFVISTAKGAKSISFVYFIINLIINNELNLCQLSDHESFYNDILEEYFFFFACWLHIPADQAYFQSENLDDPKAKVCTAPWLDFNLSKIEVKHQQELEEVQLYNAELNTSRRYHNC